MNTTATVCTTEHNSCESAASLTETIVKNNHSKETQVEKWLKAISNKLELSYLVNFK